MVMFITALYLFPYFHKQGNSLEYYFTHTTTPPPPGWTTVRNQKSNKVGT